MKITNFHKQQGATLITALGLLMVMTVVGVTATKMSSIETLIAGNEQKKMKLFQETQSELYKLTTPIKLMPALQDDTLFVNDVYAVSHETIKQEDITKLQGYTCKGIDGLAASIGGPCKLYDFKITTRSATGGAAQESHRGAGKEVPPVSPNCAICQR
jgi:hypothetical protein